MDTLDVPAFVLAFHDEVCRASCPHRVYCAERWASNLVRKSIEEAVRVLRKSPTDAAGARLAMHDVVCMSGCTASRAVDHAKTQTDAVRALRKVLA